LRTTHISIGFGSRAYRSPHIGTTSTTTGNAYKENLNWAPGFDEAVYVDFLRSLQSTQSTRDLRDGPKLALLWSGIEEETMKLALGCLAAATLIATTACGPRTPDYEKTADTALSSAALDKVNADYDKDAKTIHLKGTVDTENERQRATDVVQKAVGDGAQVANEVTVANKDEGIADDLDSGIENHLGNLVDQEADLKDDAIDFDANNGVVTISGTVKSSAERDKVGDLARSQPGVKDVVNSLEVKPNKK
jgi:osmotically-inducible protein OsmY